MTAHFEVHRAFALDSRGLFVLSGVITGGMVQTGMRATLADDEEAFAATVHGVEFIDRVNGDPRKSEPSLTFSYSSPEKLARWLSIDWEGRTLRLGW